MKNVEYSLLIVQLFASYFLHINVIETVKLHKRKINCNINNLKFWS